MRLAGDDRSTKRAERRDVAHATAAAAAAVGK